LLLVDVILGNVWDKSGQEFPLLLTDRSMLKEPLLVRLGTAIRSILFFVLMALSRCQDVKTGS